MLFFIWSLLSSAASYVRRNRLKNQLEMLLVNRGAIRMRNLAVASKRIPISNGVVDKIIITQPSPREEETTDKTVISQPNAKVEEITEKVKRWELVFATSNAEIESSETQAKVNLQQWQCLQEAELRYVPPENEEPYVYFVAKLSPFDAPLPDSEYSVVQLENSCLSLCWRTANNLEILFAATLSKFVDTMADFPDRIFTFRGRSFIVEEIETVDIDFSTQLAQSWRYHSISEGQKYAYSPFFRTLEDLCTADILAAKQICQSLSTASVNSEASTVAEQPDILHGSLMSLTGSTPPPPPPVIISECIWPPTDAPFASPDSEESLLREKSRSMSQLETTNRDSGIICGNLSDVSTEEEPGARSSSKRDFGSGTLPRTRGEVIRSSFYLPRSERKNRPETNRRSSSVFPGGPGTQNLGRGSSGFPGGPGAQIHRRGPGGFPGSPGRNFFSTTSPYRQPTREPSLAPISQNPKPPNIIVYSGDNFELFEKLREKLFVCLAADKYTIYSIKTAEFISGAPWISNSVCVIVAETEPLSESQWKLLFSYFQKGGRLLFVCQNQLLAFLRRANSTRKRFGLLKHAFPHESKELEKFLKQLAKKMKNVEVCEKFESRQANGKLEYFLSVIRAENSPLIMYMQNSHKRALALFTDVRVDELLAAQDSVVREALKRLGLDTVEAAPDQIRFSPGYLVFRNETMQRYFNARVAKQRRIPGSKLTLEFVDSVTDCQATAEYLPIIQTTKSFSDEFHLQAYFKHLDTDWLGQMLLYVPVVTSTMDVYEKLAQKLPDEAGLVVVAGHQTQGKGRAGNQWLSPAGCLMFTFMVVADLDTELGHAPGFLQHLVALAVCDGIGNLLKEEKLDLRIKWPNDIYCGRSVKIGGILVQSTLANNRLSYVIGCGLNVSNEHPTVCINSLLNSSSGAAVGSEPLLAAILSSFERLLNEFQNGGGAANFLPKYYNFWLHSGQEVTLAESKEFVVVEGLDEHGYLRVRSKSSGQIYSLQPDGNSFDMMANLIRLK